MKKIFNISLVFAMLFMGVSCDDLTEVNENPNGVDPAAANPNLLMSTVMAEYGKEVTSSGFRNTMGNSMQYTQRDSWSDNQYEWEGTGWSDFYSLLKTNDVVYQRSVDLGYEFHQGVALILKSMMFGTLTDFYGDVPYTEALQGNGDESNLFPKYDSQESIYKGIIADLEIAAGLLSKDASEYLDVTGAQDLFYNGDPAKWQKLANSLQLRYYMRLSVKLPGYAGPGITALLGKPLITSADEDCVLSFIGSNQNDSWLTTGELGDDNEYWRVKPCATLTDKLRDLGDPRADEWFASVEVPIKVVAVTPNDMDDEVVDGIRYLKESTMVPSNRKIYNPLTYSDDRDNGLVLIDTNSVYVGLPVAVFEGDVFEYNLNPQAERGEENIHVSLMHKDFNGKSGDKLKARLFSAAETHFLMSEAAMNSWGFTNQQVHYEAGIQESFNTWNIAGSYTDYIDNMGVVYDGTLEQLMEQKWIANFVNANEAYFDWRRTGFPALDAGPFAEEEVIPVRYMYDNTDASINKDNYEAVLSNGSLETTDYGTSDGTDSTWSKPWVIQGTGKPW